MDDLIKKIMLGLESDDMRSELETLMKLLEAGEYEKARDMSKKMLSDRLQKMLPGDLKFDPEQERISTYCQDCEVEHEMNKDEFAVHYLRLWIDQHLDAMVQSYESRYGSLPAPRNLEEPSDGEFSFFSRVIFRMMELALIARFSDFPIDLVAVYKSERTLADCTMWPYYIDSHKRREFKAAIKGLNLFKQGFPGSLVQMGKLKGWLHSARVSDFVEDQKVHRQRNMLVSDLTTEVFKEGECFGITVRQLHEMIRDLVIYQTDERMLSTPYQNPDRAFEKLVEAKKMGMNTEQTRNLQ